MYVANYNAVEAMEAISLAVEAWEDGAINDTEMRDAVANIIKLYKATKANGATA